MKLVIIKKQLVTLVAFAALWTSRCWANTEHLSVAIELESAEIPPLEPVQVTVILHNLTSEPLKVSNNPWSEIHLLVSRDGEEWRRIERAGLIECSIGGDRVLAPAARIAQERTLVTFSSGDAEQFVLDQPGRYSKYA